MTKHLVLIACLLLLSVSQTGAQEYPTKVDYHGCTFCRRRDRRTRWPVWLRQAMSSIP